MAAEQFSNSADDEHLTIPEFHLRAGFQSGSQNKLMVNNLKIAQRAVAAKKESGQIVQQPDGTWAKSEKHQAGPSLLNAKVVS